MEASAFIYFKLNPDLTLHTSALTDVHGHYSPAALPVVSFEIHKVN